MERMEVICPHCGCDFKIKSDKESGFCTKCGGKVAINKKNGSAQMPKSNITENQVSSVNSRTRVSSKNSMTSMILGIIIIVSAFINYSYTDQIVDKSVNLFGFELISQKFIIVEEELTFLHGLKNGVLVMGKTLSDGFIIGTLDYIHGFDNGFIVNALWLFFGWIWTFMKAFMIAIPIYFVSLYQLFIIGESLWYFVGYVISTLFMWVLIKTED